MPTPTCVEDLRQQYLRRVRLARRRKRFIVALTKANSIPARRSTGACRCDDARRCAASAAFVQQAAVALPRAINMITGSSRSADIAQILILCAHGPSRVHVPIVGSS